MARRLILAVLGAVFGLLCATPAMAADWYAVDKARVRIAVNHPAFTGQPPAVSVRIPDDIARTAQSDWVRIGSLSRPGPVFTATYQTEHRRFPSYTLVESFRHKLAFRPWAMIVAEEGPVVRSDFGPVETMKITIAKDGVERQCGYWHWQDDDDSAYFDGWYCPAVGEAVSDADIQRSVWSVRWRTQEARAP